MRPDGAGEGLGYAQQDRVEKGDGKVPAHGYRIHARQPRQPRLLSSPPRLQLPEHLRRRYANITAITDWDGVQTRCPALGYARYPSWITRDWDPVKYGWYSNRPGCTEDSPEQLLRYRQEYTAAFRAAAPLQARNDIEFSAIAEAIHIMLVDPISSSWITIQLMNWIFLNELPLTIHGYGVALAEGGA